MTAQEIVFLFLAAIGGFGAIRLVTSRNVVHAALYLVVTLAMVGGTFEVLVEGEGRKGNLKGRTRTNKLVHAAGDLGPGTFAGVRVTAAHPHHLDGELVGVGERPPVPAPG